VSLFPIKRPNQYMKGISKPQIEKVDFHLKWISREEWNINFYRL